MARLLRQGSQYRGTRHLQETMTLLMIHPYVALSAW